MVHGSEYKNTLVVLTLRAMELFLQIMFFSLIHMLILIGFFGRVSYSAAKCLMVMAVPCTILFMVRGWCNKRAVTIIAHALAFLYAIFITMESTERVAHIVVTAGLIMYSGILILNEKGRRGEHMPLGMLALFAGGMFVGALTGRKTIEEWSLYFGIVFILVQVFYHNLNNMNDLMLMNRQVSNFPAHSMIYVNWFIMSVVGVLCVGAMVLINSKYVYRMLAGIGNILVIVLRYIFRLFIHSDNSSDSDEDIILNDVKPQQNEMVMDEIQTGLFEDIMNGIAMILGVIIIVAVIICLVAAFVRLMRRFKGAKSAGEDIKEFITPDGINVQSIIQRKKESENISGQGNAKARKLYKSIVKKGAAKKGTTITSNMMPEDISAEYILYNSKEATAVYEKARYSDKEVSEKDIELLKKLRKMHKNI